MNFKIIGIALITADQAIYKIDLVADYKGTQFNAQIVVPAAEFPNVGIGSKIAISLATPSYRGFPCLSS